MKNRIENKRRRWYGVVDYGIKSDDEDTIIYLCIHLAIYIYTIM